MTETEHLLDVAIEECAEIIQRVTKAKRFGLREVQPAQDLSNAQRIAYEVNDLIAVIDMLLPQLDWQDDEAIEAKKAKVEKYLRYSEECGTLTR